MENKQAIVALPMPFLLIRIYPKLLMHVDKVSRDKIRFVMKLLDARSRLHMILLYL